MKIRNMFIGTFLSILVAITFSITTYSIPTPFPPWVTTLFTTNSIMTLTAGRILVGDSNGQSADVVLSGDATMSNAGALSLAANTVNSSELVDGGVDLSHMSSASVDSDNLVDGTVALVDMASDSVDEDNLLDITADGLHALRVARATYDFTEHGGAQSTISLGVALPANALIHKAWAWVETQIVDGGSGTIALECEDSGNILSATDESGVAAGADYVIIDDTGANAVGGIASACNISIVIGGATISAGKHIFFVSYMIED